MQNYVTAGKCPTPWTGDKSGAAVCGAWVMTFQAGAWKCEFGGTHQRVPFHTTGRTAGRSLRAMRRALEREKIPVW